MNLQPGDRIRLMSMDDSYTQLTPGEEGTVIAIDALGTVHVA
jgi:hypothetical protein